MAIGAGATAASSVAVGTGATASGFESTAVGDRAAASGSRSVALGADSRAQGNNSVALGAGTVATRNDSVSVGGRVITDVAPGTQATDAVNVAQLKTEVKRLDRRIDRNVEDIARNRADIGRLTEQVDEMKGKAYSGIAAAATLSTLIPLTAPGETAVVAGIAHYEGETAVGVNVTHRLRTGADRNIQVNAGVAVTTDETVLTRVLAGFKF